MKSVCLAPAFCDYKRCCSCRRGFTLTEVAIVLGVSSLLMGAIWIGSGKLSEAKRLDITVKSVEMMTQQYRDLYTNTPQSDPSAVDMTCKTVAARFLPQDMPLPPNKACVAGDMTTYPQHPWGSNIKIVRNSMQITTWFYNLPREICIQLEGQLSALPGVQSEVINQANGSNGGPVGVRMFPPAGTDQPFTAAELDALCLPGNSNLISIGFKI